MSVQRAPILSIKFAADGNSMLLTDAGEKEYLIPCRLSDRDAGEYRKALKAGLDTLKNSLRGSSLRVIDAAIALDGLNRRGLSVVWQIFGDQLERVTEIFQQSYPAWRSETEPAVMTVAAELSRFVPFELLPLFELSEWPVSDDLPTLEAAARRFPGFSTIVRRVFLDLDVSQDLVLQNEPKLPLKCFVYRKLGGADAEIDFFKDNASYIDMDSGPWPAARMKRADFSRSLARYLRHADQSLDGQARLPMDQIQHFACHCEIDENLSSDSVLRFSDGNEATIAELQSYFAIPDGTSRPPSGPLIFLNACGTSRIDPMAVVSFPKFFLKENRNRGFIGTETNVPDGFAAEFSQMFYRSLLRGVSLGRAIYDAKWAMLREKNSPLGILYTVYADPDLCVSKPVDAAL
jgi:hypothetical protein